MKNKMKGSYFGFIIGDALGVPAEFKSRTDLQQEPFVDMVGYGSHNQPAGTWSDDSSMTLATMEWLNEQVGNVYHYDTLMDKFKRWLMDGEYTPYGNIFDYGYATSAAIKRYMSGHKPLECGGTTSNSNGNGSLMRILPIAFRCYKDLLNEETVAKTLIEEISALTHAHLRSKMACFLYSAIIAHLLAGETKKEAMINGVHSFKKMYETETNELPYYERLFDVESFQNKHEDEIESSGYVVHTLEAALWCFLNSDNYQECVLKAVNLGDDSDTVAAIAGGLAGLYYGYDALPQTWVQQIANKEWVDQLIDSFFEKG